MANMKKSKSTDKMPARRMPEGFEFTKKKPTPSKPPVKRPGVKPVPLGTPPAKPAGRRPAPMARTTPKSPAKMTPKPKVTKKPSKMTPEDAAMKKILESKYGKIYG